MIPYIIATYKAKQATEEIKNEKSIAELANVYVISHEVGPIQQHQVEDQTIVQVSNEFRGNIANS